MSSVQNRRLVVSVGVVALLMVLGFWFGLPSEERGSLDEVGRQLASGGPEATPSGSPADRVLPVRTTRSAAAIDDPVMVALAPRLQHLRCSAGGLELGAYDTRPAENHFADVVQDGLHIAVPDGDGSAWLERDVRAVAQVRWSGDGCEVVPVRLVPVRGTLTQADGRPAVDHTVRGCLHGEHARTDSDGRWELMAVAETTCHPMAFVEHEDGRFGKSNVLGVDVSVPGPMEGVELVLPADGDLWTLEQQHKMAGQLAMMLRKMTDRRRVRIVDMQAAAEGLSGDARSRADALVAREADFLAMVDGELDRLADPDERQLAVRDAWLALN